MKIAINRCFGGFRLSPLALTRYAEKKGKSVYFYKQTKYNFKDKVEECVKVSVENADDWAYHFTNDLGDVVNDLKDAEWFSVEREDRADPDLISVVEELGEKCNTAVSNIQVVEIPDGVDWVIEDYDGNEHVAENHRTW